jgi:hypothetical protein
MIEALGGTLAPIARSEKPQLSPWHATSFIKNVLRCSGFRENCRHRQSGKATLSGDLKFHLCRILLDFFDYWALREQHDWRTNCDRTQDQQSCSTFRQRRLWDFELCRPSQFCNRLFGVFARCRAAYCETVPKASKSAQNHAGVTACQRLGQGLALFPYLRRRPN